MKYLPVQNELSLLYVTKMMQLLYVQVYNYMRYLFNYTMIILKT